jgi:O-acetyl-ADP-ribose deacetylase (regulator of RNase III)
MKEKIEILQGDITQVSVDAIVNAANTSLLGGGGVDGAIHQAAGPALLAECQTLGGCTTGEAKITDGYNLPARYVIHTPGPIWRGGQNDEDRLLANSYQNSLSLTTQHAIQTIAFPSISTGIYGFPVDRACRIALKKIWDFLQHHPSLQKVTIVCFSPDVYHAYMQAFQEIGTQE